MSHQKEFGDYGEQIAMEYLISKGFSIIEKNWHYKKKEIDIIATIDNYLVIVEVKTRMNDYLDSPHEVVTKKKQRFLVEAANAYINANEIDLETRFDVISVLIWEKKPLIDHIEDAFYPLIK